MMSARSASETMIVCGAGGALAIPSKSVDAGRRVQFRLADAHFNQKSLVRAKALQTRIRRNLLCQIYVEASIVLRMAIGRGRGDIVQRWRSEAIAITVAVRDAHLLGIGLVAPEPLGLARANLRIAHIALSNPPFGPSVRRTAKISPETEMTC